MNLPGIEDRTVVIGRTGSGKTYAGLWLLSQMPIDEMPWIVIDFKRDANIARIPYARDIDLTQMPTEPGVYVLRPYHTQLEEIDEYLMEVWKEEGIGIYIDEGVMLAKSAALDTILIQGRSKHIPVILLSQRPVGISRFAFSEAQYMMIFPNHDRREQKIIGEFAPLFQERDSDDAMLPEFNSHYYDVKAREVKPMKPVPNIDKIMATFARKLRPPEREQINDEPNPEPTGIVYRYLS